MLKLFLYAVTIMYTPGPVNLLGLNIGLRRRWSQSLGFFAGVSGAMLLLFLVFGYTGERILNKSHLIYTSIFGCVYMLYLAYRLFRANVRVREEDNVKDFSFRDGIILQLLNPKAALATLPIATIMFPDNNITGPKIALASVMLSLLALGAPSSYSFVGRYFSDFIKNQRVFKVFNQFMVVLLAYVAFTIFRDHVYLVLIGVNEF